LEKTIYRNYSIAIVDNGLVEEETLTRLADRDGRIFAGNLEVENFLE
jgi:hypothetical protein